MRYRGPDDSGIEVSGSVGFSFRRLAIIDLSPAGHQPMWDAKREVMVIFNGEIYNYLELRQQLQDQGIVFRSGTDTEVLLYLYIMHGTKALSRLNGMYAFAIYDKRSETVLLARDRLGVKPLFYWCGASKFAFASELSALREVQGFPREVDTLALSCYFRLGMVPEWTCIHPDVKKLPPGAWLRFNLKEKRLEDPVLYWDLPGVHEDESVSENIWLERIDSLLDDATRIRLRADVPLGVFLSGGIDSGLVAAAAVRHKQPLTSLTIGFEEGATDETALAKATSDRLGLDPVFRRLNISDAQSHLPAVMGHFDEPFADSSALPTSIVCAEARQRLTVVLSGDGGDEMFGGYKNHVQAFRWRHLERVPTQLRRVVGRGLAGISKPDSRMRRFARRLPERAGMFGMGASFYASHDWLESCLKPEFVVRPKDLIDLYSRNLPGAPMATGLDFAQRTDLRQFLLEDILVKVDRMSMRHSLEVRSPFLDYRMVEMALSIPTCLRVKGGANKYLLRRLADRYLPSTVCAAPKQGFSIPISNWLFHSPASEHFRQILIAPQPPFPDPFSPGGAERLWQGAQRNPTLIAGLFGILAYRWWCISRQK
jgi:asparagine synthase (glutamine-hydrolysing)